jgi:hypothetical protein
VGLVDPSKTKRGRPKGSRNYMEEVLVRSTRCRPIRLSAEAMRIAVARAQKAEAETRRAEWTEIRCRKEAWLRDN